MDILTRLLFLALMLLLAINHAFIWNAAKLIVLISHIQLVLINQNVAESVCESLFLNIRVCTCVIVVYTDTRRT